MRIPQQVSERVKEAPAQALRAVFSGIGQVLLVADRMKSRAAEPDRAASATPAPSAAAEPVPQPATTVRDETRWRSLDETGNVRLLSGEGISGSTAAATPPVPEAAGPAEPGVFSEPAEAAAVGEPGDIIVAAETIEIREQVPSEPAINPETPVTPLPVLNYDNLTVPSLRARLRSLDSAQLRVLLDYEKAHAGRADVVTMFERRIAKLESDGA